MMKDKAPRPVSSELNKPSSVRIIYNKEQKLSAIKVLKDNDYDFIMTSKELGINERTLRTWYRRYKDTELPTATQVIAGKVELDYQKMRIDFFNKHYDNLDALAKEAIAKARELLAYEEDLNKVNTTLKLVTDLFSKMQGGSDGQDSVNTPVTVNLIQQSIQMLNAKK